MTYVHKRKIQQRKVASAKHRYKETHIKALA